MGLLDPSSLFGRRRILIKDGDHLTLPPSAPVNTIVTIRSFLEEERTSVLRSRPSEANKKVGPADGATGGSSKPASSIPVQTPQQNSGEMQAKEMAFYRRLESSQEHVLIYEDQRLQQKARETIPVVQLTEEAKQTFDQMKQSSSSVGDVTNNGPEYDLQDCLILRLLNWFKNSFFKWVDAPACRLCGGKTSAQGMVQPTDEELRWGGNRVENYRCNTCTAFTRFVRYNHPGKLLETREGRCGEWANCFTLCCRALNFEARYVLDWTDHVWTEVFSNSQQRWVHCDPCENTCDKPLVYEIGWGKKLSYVIAFSVDDIEDVSWRYTSNFQEMLKRRNDCREKWLAQTLYNMDKKKWSSMPEAKRNTRLKRKVVEMVEFMTPKKPDGQNLSGRTTGSLEWRLSRGELGKQAGKSKEPHTIQLTEEEKANKCLHLIYSCAKDEYCQKSKGGDVTKGFGTMLNKSENIFRKEEHDWKMAYLAREEGTNQAEVAWKFDFSGSGLTVDSVEVKLDCKTYETGRINWLICGTEMCCPLTSSPVLQRVDDVKGESGFTLSASLSGGKGNVAWQHTQLFRQSSDDLDYYPFEIIVHLK